MNALEAALQQGGQTNPQTFAVAIEPERLARNKVVMQALVAAPKPSRLARVLGKLGVGESTTRLITATPALRRSWIVAVMLAVLFAVGADDNAANRGQDAAWFLTLAPLVPLAGVGLAFGRGVDPTHDVVVAAPMDGFRVFLVRCVSVLSASIVLLLAMSALSSADGWLRLGWLLPALAVSGAGMAAAGRFEPRMAAGSVGFCWVFAVLVVSRGEGRALSAFGSTGQLIMAAIAVVSAGLIALQRANFGDVR